MLYTVFRSAWSLLLDYIENRDQKLEAAEEIHRFNRDAADALSRIQEKSAAIPEDLGRDINTVQSLLRKHEAFENELAALEAQLQVGWLWLRLKIYSQFYRPHETKNNYLTISNVEHSQFSAPPLLSKTVA